MAIGFNGGYMLTNIAFVPTVPQGYLGGPTAGFVARYTCEKYFNMICALQLEVNYSVSGWKESILSIDDEPCISNTTGEAVKYQRELTYVQVPMLAHLSFGHEVKGGDFFLNIGPQMGYLLSEKTKSNFDYTKQSSIFDTTPERVNNTYVQDTMTVENKIDYGIAAGLGVEYHIPHAGHVLLEARYFYGLGNIYKSSKRDKFSRSNQQSIIIKASYLFDLFRTKNCVRK